MSEEPPQPDPPIKPLDWTAQDNLPVNCGVGPLRQMVILTQAQARQLYRDLERLLSERD